MSSNPETGIAMKRLILSVIILLGMNHIMVAQNASDALRYSRIFYSGTARFQGLGGAFGALGADFSVIATNPGGIGLFKSSEWTISPSFWLGSSSSSYNGDNANDNKFNFALGDLGFVLSITPHKKNNSSGFKAFNFAIGLNRQNNFNNRLYMEGPNNASSLMSSWVDILNSQPGITSSMIDEKYPFDIALANNANLIGYDTEQKYYFCDAQNGGVYQKKSVSTSGSINEFDFSFGANFQDKLYFGITFGIPTLRYYEYSSFTEFKTNETVPYFRSLTYDQTLETHGTGINFKAGIIYRPVNWVRIGAAIHTPTYYGNMRDNWYSSMYAAFDSVYPTTVQYSPDGYYDYQMTTPFRAIGSLAFIIQQYGLISAEYEYVNYNQARFHASGESFDDVNQEIKDKYTSPLNIRVGTEWRIQNFRIRGGFGYYGKPYKTDINNGEKYSASGGVGYRGKHIFCDISYVWSQQKEDYYFYDKTLVNPSHNTLHSNSVTTTFGVRF